METTTGIDKIFEARWAEELARNLALTRQFTPEQALETLVAVSGRHEKYPHTTEELQKIIAEAYKVASEKK